ncbi:FecR family protein [Hephaestia caeni]|jgi:transmembrane sensor|uniref:FecR family protein n=1 Tax=Hephaestia caeni TaxID=645617 RepID=A0A397P5Z3_9SPHN|nr:FecR domain-containing protein [Hephaestia caeni]RIA44298.1 FecR family protein [Hephaestia caeni]
MSDENADEFRPKSLSDQAVSLIVDFDADPSDDNLAALKAWYDRYADHQQAFASAMFTADMSDDVRRRIETALGREFTMMPSLPGAGAETRKRSVPAAHLQPWGARGSGEQAPARERTRRRKAVWVGGAAAAAAIVVLGINLPSNSVFNPIASPAVAKTFETGHAEIRSFALSDGTDITLDSDTRVEVTIDRARRHALLHQGRARFIVKADPRPFTIEAANGAVVAQQGTIDVEIDKARRADIRLRAGAASVQGDGYEAKPLVIDQPVIYTAHDPVPTAVTEPAAGTRDWPTGWVEYRSISLDALIAQANRYAKVPIVLDDPSLASLQASGRFKLTDTEKFTARIAEPFGLRVSRRSDGIHLSR